MANDIYNVILKIAETEDEFNQIHKLNYQIFVEEIQQHPSNEDKILIDKFHTKNTYFIAKLKNEIIGLTAVNSIRPFSLDEKLKNLDSYLPANKSIVEARLFCIKKEYRKTILLVKLLRTIIEYLIEKNYDICIISGILNQLPLYYRMGFNPFGNVVISGKASFQPIYVHLEDAWYKTNDEMYKQNKIYLTPGPAKLQSQTLEALYQQQISHRNDIFIKNIKNLKASLSKLVNSQHTLITHGSGSLANDMIAAHLATLESNGLVLSNGEFGERLCEHLDRFNINFVCISKTWGNNFDYEQIDELLSNNTNLKWLWFCHCETSTGIINNLEKLKLICQKNNIKLCVDIVSSIGITEVDLSNTYLASASSNKGLESIPGLAVVFYNQLTIDNNTLKIKSPKYLDITQYTDHQIPFTLSSNQINSLEFSLKNITNNKFEKIKILSEYLFSLLLKKSYLIITPQTQYCKPIITLQIPSHINSHDMGVELEKEGVLISYNSYYLRKRNWVQICIISECTKAEILYVVIVFHKVFTTLNSKKTKNSKKNIITANITKATHLVSSAVSPHFLEQSKSDHLNP